MIPPRLLLICGIACLLLGGVAIDWRLYHPEVAGAEQYHRRVREAIEAMPVASGDWVSEESPVPPSAQAMLRPNVILSRRYTNLSNGEHASFLLVQCLDARDLYGHYPPNCYKANGYVQTGAERRAYSYGNSRIEGTMYTFSSDKLAARGTIKVFDFMILPDDRTAPDMDGVNSIARDRRIRHFGAAQLQVVTDANMSDRDRERVTVLLLNGALGVIDVIRTGVTP
jgi:hypothetical protein